MADDDTMALDGVRYQDGHGVIWRIVTPPGGRPFAHMDQESRLVYDPEPTDVGPVSRLRVAGESPAMERQVLQQDIEAQVKALQPALKVNAAAPAPAPAPAPGVPWWVYLLGFVVLAKRKR